MVSLLASAKHNITRSDSVNLLEEIKAVELELEKLTAELRGIQHAKEKQIELLERTKEGFAQLKLEDQQKHQYVLHKHWACTKIQALVKGYFCRKYMGRTLHLVGAALRKRNIAKHKKVLGTQLLGLRHHVHQLLFGSPVHRENAAVTIQKYWRAHLDRIRFKVWKVLMIFVSILEEREKAQIRIACYYRMRLASQLLNVVKNKKKKKEEKEMRRRKIDAAVRHIQRCMRGTLARLKSRRKRDLRVNLKVGEGKEGKEGKDGGREGKEEGKYGQKKRPKQGLGKGKAKAMKKQAFKKEKEQIIMEEDSHDITDGSPGSKPQDGSPGGTVDRGDRVGGPTGNKLGKPKMKRGNTVVLSQGEKLLSQGGDKFTSHISQAGERLRIPSGVQDSDTLGTSRDFQVSWQGSMDPQGRSSQGGGNSKYESQNGNDVVSSRGDKGNFRKLGNRVKMINKISRTGKKAKKSKTRRLGSGEDLDKISETESDQEIPSQENKIRQSTAAKLASNRQSMAAGAGLGRSSGGGLPQQGRNTVRHTIKGPGQGRGTVRHTMVRQSMGHRSSGGMVSRGSGTASKGLGSRGMGKSPSYRKKKEAELDSAGPDSSKDDTSLATSLSPRKEDEVSTQKAEPKKEFGPKSLNPNEGKNAGKLEFGPKKGRQSVAKGQSKSNIGGSFGEQGSSQYGQGSSQAQRLSQSGGRNSGRISGRISGRRSGGSQLGRSSVRGDDDSPKSSTSPVTIPRAASEVDQNTGTNGRGKSIRIMGDDVIVDEEDDSSSPMISPLGRSSGANLSCSSVDSNANSNANQSQNAHRSSRKSNKLGGHSLAGAFQKKRRTELAQLGKDDPLLQGDGTDDGESRRSQRKSERNRVERDEDGDLKFPDDNTKQGHNRVGGPKARITRKDDTPLSPKTRREREAQQEAEIEAAKKEKAAKKAARANKKAAKQHRQRQQKKEEILFDSAIANILVEKESKRADMERGVTSTSNPRGSVEFKLENKTLQHPLLENATVLIENPNYLDNSRKLFGFLDQTQTHMS